MNTEINSQNTFEKGNVGYNNIPPILPQTPKKAEKKRVPSEKRDIVYAAILAVLSILTINCLCWGGVGIGVTITACALYIATFVYLFKLRRHFSPYTAAVGILFVILSTSLTFSDAGFGKVLAVITMAALYVVTVMDITAARYYPANSLRSVCDFFRTAVATPLDDMGRCMWALFHRKDDEGKISRRKTGGILAGIACAVPLVLIIVLPLLVSSDAAFQGLLSKLRLDMSTEIIVTLILGIVLFALLFSQAFAVKLEKNIIREKTVEHSVEPSAVCSFLCVLSFVYLLYIFSQLAYFFNAFSGILPKGFTMAEYARRGFFEMCAICIVNLVTVLISTHISRKTDGRSTPAVRIPSVFICGFSLLLIATSISKMAMYIKNCGMTHLRIFTSLFMIFPAVVFISVILRLFIKQIPYVQIALITASVLIAAAVFADIDKVVASYNINAYLNAKLDTIDTYTISRLDSDAVVPYLFRLAECDDALVAEDAKAILRIRFCKYFDVKPLGNGKWEIVEDSDKNGYDFRGYNIYSYRARKLLLENMHFLFDGFILNSERY